MKKERIHPVKSPEGKSPEEMAYDISRLRYDAIEIFLAEFAKNLLKDAEKDEGKGRVQLAEFLRESSRATENLRISIHKTWVISKPHMGDELIVIPDLLDK